MKTKALSFIIAAILSVCVILTGCGQDAPPTDPTPSESVPVDIVKGGASEYKIVYSTNDTKGGTMAYAVKQEIEKATGVTLEIANDSEENTYELLIGDTSRALSAEVKAALSALTSEESYMWGFAYKDGKLAFYYNSKIAFDLGLEEFKSLYLKDGTLTVASDTFKKSFVTVADYEAEVNRQEAAEKAVRIEALKAEIAAFDDEIFGERTPMPTGLYDKPEEYPKSNQHPRLLLTSDMIPKIKGVLENPDYESLASTFWKFANKKTDGKLASVSPTTSNFDDDVLTAIEAKALAYLLTGDEEYGYSAICASKNYMLTLSVTHDLGSDIFLYFSRSMQVMGEVYDWCYSLMSDLDRSQFVRGVQKYLCEDCSCGKTDKITIGFPPTKLSGVNGHGTNCMLQRDYLSFALAIYDEYPDWWELVAGRYYEEFVPASNVFFESGSTSQGTNNYIWNKAHAQLCAAWIIKVATGKMPYAEETANLATYVMQLRLPNGRLFQSGDSPASSTGSSDRLGDFIHIAAALFPSESYQINANVLTKYYTSYKPAGRTAAATPTTFLIYRANGLDYNPESTDINKGLDTIWYADSPMAQMTVRNAWCDDAAVVFMRIGELSGGNHDHQDFGTFQIYYKGCFTSESGRYGEGAGYGTSHWRMWAQSTISHNGLLIYNPAFADSEAVFDSDGAVDNDKRFFYSGSQRVPTTGSTVDSWLSGGATMGKTTGVSYGYKAENKVEYAYIAGDITAAYSSETVDAVGRRMLTVYTESEEFPMFFIVYDYIKSTDASFKKSFLMHTVKEPTIEGNTATYVQNDGKIVLITLTDGAVMTKYGGEGKTYWINDTAGNVNIAEEAGGTGAAKGDSDTISDGALWGRVQIDNTGKLEDHLLNFIYVTDATNDNTVTPTRIESDDVIGLQVERAVAVFSKGITKNRKALEFSTVGEGTYSYYISGLSEGSWTVKANGVAVGVITTTEDSGFIKFDAPSGDITIEPGKDVRPANSDDITFILGGGTLPEDTVNFYLHDTEYILPDVTSPTNTAVFAGWYLSATSNERVYSIPAGTRGPITLYAKFYEAFTEDYETTTVNVSEAKITIAGIRYVGEGKTGSCFTTVKDPVTNNTYLRWQCGDLDPEIDKKERLADFIVGSKRVTFEVDIALDGDSPVILTNFRLRGDHSSKSASVFTTKEDGSVCLGGSADHVVGYLTKELQHFTFGVDFETCMIYAFDENGDVIVSKELILPTAFTETMENATGLDYLDALIFIFDWYATKLNSEDAALRFDNLKIYAEFPA